MLTTVRRITARLEIAFWSLMIPLMSASSLVQACLPSALALLDREKDLRSKLAFSWKARSTNLGKILAWSCAGLVLGLILGYLKARAG